EKIHCGCYPVGMDDQTIGGSEIKEVVLSSGEISVTTNIIEKGTNGADKYTEGIGHFTINYDKPNGKHVSVRILKKGEMVNYHDCSGNIDPNEVNPFTRIWKFEPELTPPHGTTVTVALSIYWECIYDNGNAGVGCKHEDVSLNAS
ncbi:21060_t:CDS:2, partial [Rhizophagus irregularis]